MSCKARFDVDGGAKKYDEVGSDTDSEFDPSDDTDDITDSESDSEDEMIQEDSKKSNGVDSKSVINKIHELMKKEYKYPSTDDPNFQAKIFAKRDFHGLMIPDRDNIKTYDDVKEYRENVCARNFSLRSHQTLLSNFINPNTPYKGVLVFHGTGTGKTCAGISIAEEFKPMVQKYNTKIYVLVSGPTIREVWKDGIIQCTGETYLKNIDKNVNEIRAKKMAQNSAMQYYKFLSYRSFYKRVLGDKIIDKKVLDNEKVKSQYRKNEQGTYERLISFDKIDNLIRKSNLEFITAHCTDTYKAPSP